ncbi:histidinol phosphate phosphatase, partial [Nitrincola sp. A-D6]|uniref:inositol monophosphatase family protein n=1 Tax=Nitrincola sp. A-D6 TaxID=1545442 RepID=UPI00051FA74E
EPCLGIIEMPALEESWVGIKGQGTFFSDRRSEDKPCQVSACRQLSEACFYTTSLYYFSEADRRAVEQVIAQVAVPRFGGDCYGYGLLASGLIDLVIESQLQPFDFLSLIPIIEEAGGIITDWQGATLTSASDGRVIAAATPELHQQAMQWLNQYCD